MGAMVVGMDRSPQLPAHLRERLRQALLASFGEVPDGVDIDALGLELLRGMTFILGLDSRGIHRPVSAATLTPSCADGNSGSETPLC